MMELDNLYQEVILDHYKRPQNKKLATDFDAQVHHVNPSCGDEIDLNLTIQDNLITSITWDGVGCSISQASVSIASDLLVNKSFAEADAIAKKQADEAKAKAEAKADTKADMKAAKEEKKAAKKEHKAEKKAEKAAAPAADKAPADKK